MNPRDYLHIRAWELVKHSDADYIAAQQDAAAAANAPLDVVYFSQPDNRWIQYSDIQSKLMRECVDATLRVLERAKK